MVKDSTLKKSELLTILSTARTSKERNRAVKLLKQFDPNPKKELDEEGDPKNLTPKKYSLIQAFVCYRCDKVKQTQLKVKWNTSQGLKTICHTCFVNLTQMKELEARRR